MKLEYGQHVRKAFLAQNFRSVFAPYELECNEPHEYT
jgi:hypothetical protein